MFQVQAGALTVDHKKRRAVVEASDLGLTSWPPEIKVLPGWEYAHGSKAGCVFYRHHEVTDGEDLVAKVYVGPNGWELHVLND